MARKPAKKSTRKTAKKSAGKPTQKSAKKSTMPAKKSAGKSASARKAAKKSAKTGKKAASAKKGQSSKKAKKSPAPADTTPASAPDANAAAESTPAKKPRRRRKPSYATAESMARDQRSISVSEFFAKNRHLLGFDNPRKALLTTVREAVDNALDACEEAGILPVIEVTIEQIDEDHFRAAIQDNGPGIVKRQIPNIFGKLLYGSKFHRLKMSRGQQGIGISAAGMYGLLTTGRPVRITSRTSPRQQAHFYELQIDTRRNKPDIITDQPFDWDDVEHGTKVEIELEARYAKGRQSVDEYLAQTAIANPHVTLIYHAPDGRSEQYPASIQQLPELPKSIKPHPHGVELGVLLKMMQDSKARSVQQFLTSEFSRVSSRVAKQICDLAGISPKAYRSRVNGEGAKAIYRAIQDTKILAPSTNCVVPIGEEQLLAGLQQVVQAGFYTSVTRRPAVYRGNPFIIEAALAYGKPDKPDDAPKKRKKDKSPLEEPGDTNQPLARVLRFANRVPLQYQQGACAITKCVQDLNWKSYGLSQSRGGLPAGDLTIVVHMASVWVPFTSESKEAVASYPEILKEIRLALQECGRKLGAHVRRAVRLRQELKKRSYIEKYIPAIGEALRDILDLKDKQVDGVCEELKGILERSRKM